MKASSWAALSFGCTLGLVVGWRLSPLGLLVVAGLLCPLLLRRWIEWYLDQRLPEVWVERGRAGGLGAPPARRYTLEAPPRQARRGGWPHLERMGWGAEIANVER